MATTAVTYNGAIPAQPQAINTFIEINANRVLVDLTMQLAQGKIAGVQTIYVDLLDHLGDVSIVMPDTGQRIIAKAQTQGYYPVLSTNLMKFEITSNVNGKFPIQFINFPIAGAVWGFNLIKGDKGADGEKGENGENGGTVITIDSDNPDGESIALFDADPDTGENFIMLKKLIAGSNITINDLGDALEINSTGGGGGGGGGGGFLSYAKYLASTSLDVPAVPAANTAPLDLTNAFEQVNIGGYVKGVNGIEIPESGRYLITVNLKANATGDNYLSIDYQGTVYSGYAKGNDLIQNSSIVTVTFLIQAMKLGVPTMDVFKFIPCNPDLIMDNYILNIEIAQFPI